MNLDTGCRYGIIQAGKATNLYQSRRRQLRSDIVAHTEPEMVNLDSRVTIPPDVLFREVAGEAVLLHLETGKYYGLDVVGARIWALLAEQRTIEEASVIMSQEFAATVERLQLDIMSLVDRLSGERLVRISQPIQPGIVPPGGNHGT